MIEESKIAELLRTKNGRLFHREGQELEFKEQFNLAGLPDYLRDFAAFANNRGGYLIFGVKNAPRIPIGMSKSAINQFEKIDPEKISGFILEIFSSSISWEQAQVDIGGKAFGVFRIEEAWQKPVIAKKDEGKDQVIKNGEIYFRYGGRTQKALHAELQMMIERRLEENNRNWQDLISKIARAGPQNAAILDTEKGLIEKDDARILVIDDELAEKIKFVKEGQFVEKDGAITLKLVGNVVPVDQVEVVKKVQEKLTQKYPLTARELAEEVLKNAPGAKQHEVWQAIAENKIKQNPDYSAYNFRSKKQEDEFRSSGMSRNDVPSIYNQSAVELLVRLLTNRPEG